MTGYQSSPSTIHPEKWVDLYADALLHYAIRAVGNQDVAEELIQETFLAALRGTENFAGKSSEKTWLTSILKHKIIDYYRKNQREKLLSPHDMGEGEDFFFDDRGRWRQCPQVWEDASKNLERKEFWEVLERCLARLPSHLARVIQLRTIQDWSSQEVCDSLQISAANLWTSLHRARLQIRQCLQMNWFDDE